MPQTQYLTRKKGTGSAILSVLVIITLLLIPVIFLQTTTAQKLRFAQGELERIEANVQAQTNNNNILRLLHTTPTPQLPNIQVVTDQLSTLNAESEAGSTIKTDQYLLSLSQSVVPRANWGAFQEQLAQNRCGNWEVTNQRQGEVSSQRTCTSLRDVSAPGALIPGNIVLSEELFLSHQSPTPANLMIAVIGLVHLPKGLRVQSSAPLQLAIIAAGAVDLAQITNVTPQLTSVIIYSSKEVVKIMTWPTAFPHCDPSSSSQFQFFASSPIRIELGEHSIQEPAIVGCLPELSSPWWRRLKILGHINSW